MAPYDLSLRVSADYGAIATLISRGAGTIRIDQPIAIRDCHPDGLSERATACRFADFLKVQRRILNLGLGVGAAHSLASRWLIACVPGAAQNARSSHLDAHTAQQFRRDDSFAKTS